MQRSCRQALSGIVDLERKPRSAESSNNNDNFVACHASRAPVSAFSELVLLAVMMLVVPIVR